MFVGTVNTSMERIILSTETERNVFIKKHNQGRVYVVQDLGHPVDACSPVIHLSWTALDVGIQTVVLLPTG